MNTEYENNNGADYGWNVFYSTWSKLVATYGADSAEAKCPSDPQLRAWVERQRSLKRSGNLEFVKEAILNREGFDWDYASSDAITLEVTKKPRKPSKVWTEKVNAMVSELSVRSCVEICDSGDKFAKMASYLRTGRKNGKLSADLVMKLTAAHFIWDWREFCRCRTWDAWFVKLLAWTQLNGGDPNMKRAAKGNRAGVNNYTPEEETLANWVWTQRCDARKGKLNHSQIERLIGLGVWLNRDSHTVEKAVAAIESYHAETGSWWNDDDRHSNRVVKDAAKAGTLTKALRIRLDAIGFDENLDGRDLHWAKKVDDMVEFKAKHGHCDVSGREKNYLRQSKKLGIMPDDVAAKFEALGFVWRERRPRRSFDETVRQLKFFHKLHGHWPKSNDALGNTVNHLRSKFNRGEMSGEDFEALCEIGFVFDARNPINLAA